MDVQACRVCLWMLIGCLALTGMGCTHVISDTLRQQAQPPVAFAELRTNPEALKGRTVIVGGEILQTTNLRDGHAHRGPAAAVEQLRSAKVDRDHRWPLHGPVQGVS